jgi:hypothetical protein
MKNNLTALASLLLMLGLISQASLGQISKPSVYIDPHGPLVPYLAAAIANKKVPIELVTDRSSAVYILRTSDITTRTSYVGASLHTLELTVGAVTAVLSGSTSDTVVWSDSLSEPTEGNKTEQALAELVAKRLKKFVEKAHGDLAAGAKPERSYSIAALVGSLFSH